MAAKSDRLVTIACSKLNSVKLCRATLPHDMENPEGVTTTPCPKLGKAYSP